MTPNIFTANGIKCIHIPHSSNIVNFRFTVKAGSMDENPGAYGVAHYLEHMFFKGTKRRNWEQLNLLMSKYGSVNAHTTYDKTAYFITCTKRKAEQALALLAEMFFEPALPEDEFLKERTVILDEKQIYEDRGDSVFYFDMIEKLFGDKGHWVIGTDESLKQMNIQHIHDFRNQFYRSDNMIFSVVGDISPETLEQWTNKMFLPLESGFNNRVEGQAQLNDFHFHHPAKQAHFALVAPGESSLHTLKRPYVDSLFHECLTGGLHSLLYKRLREELGLCYNVNSYHAYNQTSGYNSIMFALDEQNIDKTLKETDSVFKDILQNGVAPEILDASCESLVLHYARKHEVTNSLNLEIENYFDYPNDSYPLQLHLDFNTIEEALYSITNDDIRKFANDFYGNGQPKAVLKMTHGERKLY